MKTLIATFFALVLTASADTYYVRYFADTGDKVAYSVDFPSESFRISVDGSTFTGFPDFDLTQRVFATSIDPSDKANKSEFPDAIILNARDLSFSIRRTPEWNAVTNAMVPYASDKDTAIAAINAETGAAKTADNALKALIQDLQAEIVALKHLIGKNMQVEP